MEGSRIERRRESHLSFLSQRKPHTSTHARTGPLRDELGDLLRVHVAGVHGEAVAALDLVRLRPVLGRAHNHDVGRDLVVGLGGWV